MTPHSYACIVNVMCLILLLHLIDFETGRKKGLSFVNDVIVSRQWGIDISKVFRSMLKHV